MIFLAFFLSLLRWSFPSKCRLELCPYVLKVVRMTSCLLFILSSSPMIDSGDACLYLRSFSFSRKLNRAKKNNNCVLFFLFRLMRKSRYLLDRDLKDKFAAQTIDEHAIDLSVTSPSLYLKEGVANIDPRYVNIDLCMQIEGILSLETENFLVDGE